MTSVNIDIHNESYFSDYLIQSAQRRNPCCKVGSSRVNVKMGTPPSQLGYLGNINCGVCGKVKRRQTASRWR